jgi:hypothetical protein
MQSISILSTKLLVITSLRAGNYDILILPKFDKQLVLSKGDRRKIDAEFRTGLSSSNVTITERDLKIVRQQRQNLGSFQ